MNPTRVSFRKAVKIGKGEPKIQLVAERDGVTMQVAGDWLLIAETSPPHRAIAVHGSQIEQLELDPEQLAESIASASPTAPAAAAAGGKGRR